MISKEEVRKLSNLARLEFNDVELDEMGSKLSSILDYVGQINSVLTDSDIEINHSLKNIARPDVIKNTTGEFTESLLKEAPQSEGGYVKVKKII